MLLLATSVTFSLTSCYDDTELWNSIDNLDARVGALEKKCEYMNNDIAALQTIVNALKTDVFVSNVVQTKDGYVINFSDGTSATIYNGIDGAKGDKGDDGLDGYTPVVSIGQASDGILLNGTVDVTVDGKVYSFNVVDGVVGVLIGETSPFSSKNLFLF